MTVGERIKSKRIELKLTQKDIFSLTGISNGNLSKIENDLILPSSNALISLSSTLKVSIDWILKGIEASDRIMHHDLIDKYERLDEKDKIEIEMLIDMKLKLSNKGLSSDSMTSDKYNKIG